MEILFWVYFISVVITALSIIMLSLVDGKGLSLGGLIIILIIACIPIFNTLFSIAILFLWLFAVLLVGGSIFSFKIIKSKKQTKKVEITNE